MRRRLIVCGIAVAVGGLLGALAIYLRAGDDDGDDNVQVVIVDGKTYKIPLASTKMYQRDLRRFGGEAAVLADEINRWFAGLWRGKALATTIAWITVFVSGGVFLLARQFPAGAVAADGDDAGGERPG